MNASPFGSAATVQASSEFACITVGLDNSVSRNRPEAALVGFIRGSLLWRLVTSNGRQHMERWEIIERRVLVVVGAAMLAICMWLAFVQSGPERVVWLALLVPCTYWVFWQAFFEDKLQSGAPVTWAERVMWLSWLWLRRVALGTIAALFAAGAFHLAAGNALGAAALLFVLAIVVAWVAAYGGGRHKSAVDDRRIHNERVDRYK